MKLNKTLSTILLALTGLASMGSNAAAQAVASDGDIVLGMRATGTAAGVSTNYCIKLGTAGFFRDATTIQTLPLSGASADIAAIYGLNWHSSTDVLWGVVGKTASFSATNGDPAATNYATAPEPTNGVLATAWQRDIVGNQRVTRNRIDSFYINGFNLGTAATNAATIARTVPSNGAVTWTSNNPGGSIVDSFQTWTNIEGNPTNYLDFFRMESGSGPGTLLGRMIFHSDATLTFIPASLIGVNTVQFSAATYAAAEDVAGGVLNVTATRTGDTSGATTVTVSTADVSALAGTDYTALSSQNVSFAVNETSKVVPITLVNRSGVQGDRSFTVTLGGATGGTTIGAQGMATCTISDSAVVVPSVVQLASATYSANLGAASVTINFTRTGGAGAVTFTLSATDDTAEAGVNYTAPSGTVTIPANANTGSTTIALLAATSTQHLQFNIAISNPVGADTIGALNAAVVRLLTTDTARPTLTVTGPAASVPENASDTVNITGNASDDKAIIDRVQIRLNGAAPVNAELTPGSTGAAYALSATPIGGLNTFSVQAFDAKGNPSVLVTKTFTYSVKRAINLTVNTAQGTVAIKPGAVYEVGKPLALVAKPAAGFVFSQWIPANGTLTTGQSRTAALNAIFTDAMARTFTTTSTDQFPLQALFVATPFTATLAGAFNGLIVEDGTGLASNATNGDLTLNVGATGAFTGTMRVDGLVIKTIAGTFDSTGAARFGAAGSSTLLVARTTKPSYELMLNMDLATSGNTNQITGTLKQKVRAATVSNSIVTLNRAHFSAATPVPPSYLANKGFYTIALPARASQPGLTTADYPQGDGVGSITVTNVGKVTAVITLPDSLVPFTITTTLDKNRSAALFAPLYKNAGCVGGRITLDENLPDTDVSGTNLFWIRPWQNVHHYPWGWANGIALDLVGAKYAVTGGVSVLPDLTTAPANATLSFSDGLLTADQDNDVFVSTANVVTSAPAGDTSFKATITAAKGTVVGDFTHEDNTKPKFAGIILQKGANKGGFGFFLSTQPKVITGVGQSGAVQLLKK